MANPDNNVILPDVAPADYTDTIYDGNLPAALGTIAKKFATQDPGELKSMCKAFYTFLKDPHPDLNQLNHDTRLYTAFVPLPASMSCRLCYGFNIGANPIGRTSPLNNQLLALYHEGSKALGPPLSLMFGTGSISRVPRLCPSGTRVRTALTAATVPITFPLFRSSAIANESAELMMIAPVPAHLFFDAFEKDLQAPEIYERLLRCDEVNEEHTQHALGVIRAVMLKTNQDQKEVHLHMNDLIASSGSPPLRQWARQRSLIMFPEISALPPLPPPPFPAAAPQRPPETEVQVIKTMPAAKEKMSKRERTKIFTMLGYSDKVIPNLTEADLPPHMLAVEEESTKHMKESVIKERLAKNIRYEDCPIPAHPGILDTLRKRDFGGMDSFAHPSYAQACTKLTPFLCVDMTETQMAKIQEMEEAFTNASVTTPADYIAMKSTKATVPRDYMDFVHLLCTFANLIYAWFTSASPLFVQLKSLIEAIKAYHRTARSFFTTETKATILWLTFLQTRLFADGEGEAFSPFTRMIDNLRAKDAIITYAEVPKDLITNSSRTPAPSTPQYKSGDKRPADDAKFSTPNQPPKKPNRNTWHPRLKEAFAPGIALLRKKGVAAKQMSLKQICGFCGVNSMQFAGAPKTCTNNKVLGQCYNGEACLFKHTMATDDEVEKILGALGKFKETPEAFQEYLQTNK